MINDFKSVNNLRHAVANVNHLGLDTTTELLNKMYAIFTAGYVETISHKNKDGGVGSTLEYFLDIEENNSKDSDYKSAIELKSKKKNEKTSVSKKITLFNQTPSDYLIKLHGKNPSPQWIVENKGYLGKPKDGETEGRLKLYCGVGANYPNGRGWILNINKAEERVYLLHYNELFCYWDFSVLEERFYTKHKETMFITADTKIDDNGIESFRYSHIVHAKKPSFEKFVTALEERSIILDVSFSTQKNGSVKNRGWPFRTTSKYVPYIFREVCEYNLHEVKNLETNQLEFIKNPISIIGENKMYNGISATTTTNVHPTITGSEIIIGRPEFIKKLVDNDLTKILPKGKVFHAKSQSALLGNMADAIIAFVNQNGICIVHTNSGARHKFEILNPTVFTNIVKAMKDRSLYEWIVEDLGVKPSTYKSSTLEKITPISLEVNQTPVTSTTEVNDLEHAFTKIADSLENGEITTTIARRLITLL